MVLRYDPREGARNLLLNCLGVRPGDHIVLQARTGDQVRGHYRRVASLFGIEEDVVHSWHAGIHPKAFYPLSATSNILRWGSVAFANPRYLHFHTCGNYAPGEIAWSLFDVRVEVDGEVYWDAGRFTFLDRPEIRARLPHYDLDDRALEQRFDIGI